jgi:hypothetical protein
MNFLSESLTVGVLLTLVFGAIFFYLYTRMSYTEKRLSLIESILLDIKMNTENMMKEEPEYAPEPITGPEPLETKEVEQLPDESYYKGVIEAAGVESEEMPEEEQQEVKQVEIIGGTRAAVPSTVVVNKVSVNYESLTKSELHALLEKKGLKYKKTQGRNDLINLLRKSEQPSEVQGSSSSNEIFPMSAEISDTSGFAVDLGAAESE